MPKGMHVSLWDLVCPLARTFDLMSPAMAEHSLRVAYLALRLAEELGLPPAERRELALAGALHDVGAFSLQERLDLLAFEDSRPMQHARAGCLLLKTFEPFARIASLVEFHHVAWDHGSGRLSSGRPVPSGSHLLHLADRVSVLVSKEAEVLGQVPGILASIADRSGSVFVPEQVDALQRLGARDFVWLDLASDDLTAVLQGSLSAEDAELDSRGLIELARLICRLIDFKSAFTATHSSGVAAAGAALARRVGFSAEECRLFQVAAYLHDLGKLAIPSEILEKPGRLTADEWDVMRTHVYYTYHILNPIEALGQITSWGALHQERLDGSGYPFGYTADALPLGARVMAVADVFTGITENRPYRRGMAREEALAVLRGMAERGELDRQVVDLLGVHFDEISRVRAEAQARAAEEYMAFLAQLG